METVSELPEHMWEKRLALEHHLIREYEPLFDTVDSDLTHYRGVIAGAGLYMDGYFTVEVIIPRTFPYTPPKIIWHTRIWHPNFSDEVPARVFHSILKEDWQPRVHIFTIIEELRALLSEPNPEDPCGNETAGMEMRLRPDVFESHVRQYLARYAEPDQAFHDVRIRQEPEFPKTKEISVLAQGQACFLCGFEITSRAETRSCSSCGAVFHLLCYKEWLTVRTKCPQCRHEWH